jgi:hypothetical protein
MSENRQQAQQTQPDPAAALRAALDSAQRDNAALRVDRDTARTQLRGETANRFQAQETAVDNAIVAAETEANTLESQWSTLQAEGKFEEAAKAMRRMTDASARLHDYHRQKDYIAQQRQQAAQQSADPLAQYSPEARSWIARNPRFLSDTGFKDQVTAAHHAALGAGKGEGSSDYFDHIERAVYPERYAAANGGDRAADTQQQSRQTQNAGGVTNEEEGGSDEAPFSDTGADGNDSANEPVIRVEDRHTMTLASSPVTIPANEMRIDVNADGSPITVTQEPQVRAVGKGGSGIQAVAAPPSRALNRALQGAGRTGPITLSADEMDAATRLAEQIEPEILGQGQLAVAKWYAAMNALPSANRRRQKWYGSAS